MFGVSISEPWYPTSAHPKSSAMTTRMFGRAAAPVGVRLSKLNENTSTSMANPCQRSIGVVIEVLLVPARPTTVAYQILIPQAVIRAC